MGCGVGEVEEFLDPTVSRGGELERWEVAMLVVSSSAVGVEGAVEGQGAEGQKLEAICLGGRVRTWKGPASKRTGAKPQPRAQEVGLCSGRLDLIWRAVDCGDPGLPLGLLPHEVGGALLLPAKTSEVT